MHNSFRHVDILFYCILKDNITSNFSISLNVAHVAISYILTSSVSVQSMCKTIVIMSLLGLLFIQGMSVSRTTSQKDWEHEMLFFFKKGSIIGQRLSSLQSNKVKLESISVTKLAIPNKERLQFKARLSNFRQKSPYYLRLEKKRLFFQGFVACLFSNNFFCMTCTIRSVRHSVLWRSKGLPWLDYHLNCHPAFSARCTMFVLEGHSLLSNCSTVLVDWNSLLHCCMCEQSKQLSPLFPLPSQTKWQPLTLSNMQ